MNPFLLFVFIVFLQSIVNGKYLNQDHATWTSDTHDRSDGNLVIYSNSLLGSLRSSRTRRSSDVDCRNEKSWPDDWIEFEDEVLSLVNRIRAEGAFCANRWRPPVSPLRQNLKLTRSARCHAVDMAVYGYFSHVDRRGGTIGRRIKEAGYQYRSVAENIAQGQTSPHQVVDRWINSPGHCLSIMGDYREIGIAYIGDDHYQHGHLWVQNFGTSW